MDAELFRNRVDAGEKLSACLSDYKDSDTLVLAIPRGGVPVGYKVAENLDAEFDVIIPRKLPIPWNPEAGFGAVTADGTLVLNDKMVEELDLSPEEIEAVAEGVREEVQRRMKVYRGERPLPRVSERPVIIVDDGLASGYTMLAAVESLRRHAPREVVVAVPVASRGASRLIESKVDRLVSLITSERIPFAVASYYSEWRELSDEDVTGCLQRAGEELPGNAA
jgi:putative phosphoribosyl transferase